MVEELQGRLIHIEVAARSLVAFIMGSTSSQPETQPSAESQPRDSWKPISLCGTLPTLVVPAERYVEQLWATLDKTLLHSGCGIGSDTPVGKGVGIPPPPEYLPEMKDEQIVKNTIKALSPRIVAVHGPTGTGKSTVFPLAITHWTNTAKGLQSGLNHLCTAQENIGTTIV